MMAKYCKKCGTQLDDDTGLCPKCDAKKIKRLNKQQKKKSK
ncbi:MAG: zinc-ribbon domain-containing protein [Erysipelotrichaceae bacterium]|nr:zinc-ribbon domain-containing protein [Erysipelotrichaceae bacterium]